MAQLAILAAIEIGLAVAKYALTTKPKTQAVDRGRLDDLRVQTAEEGTHIPICFGKQVRLAGVIVDGSATQEYKTTTPGRSGSKGGGGGAGEGPVTNFGYKKTFAILGGIGPIKSFLQIKETTGSGTDTIFDLRPSIDNPSSVYEAEDSSNTLAGGALIVDDATMSGGRRVSLPANASVTFTGLRANFTQTYLLSVYYVSSALGSLGVKINAGSEATIALSSSGGTRAATAGAIIVPAGTSNTIRLKNLGAGTISIDSIFFFADLPDDEMVTGVIDPGIVYPAELAAPHPYYNYAPQPNGRGETTGTFAAGGQSPFELYLGTEDQLQSPTLVALHGASHVSALRGYWYVVANQYEVKGGQLGNFTFTVEPMIQDVSKILDYLFLETNQADPDDLDFSRMEGTICDGLIYDRGDPIGAYVDALALWHSFDIVPCGGKITAIPRGGASIVSIPEIDLFGREEGSEFPHGALSIDHLNELEISGAVDVLYSDSSETKDFHTGKQHYSRELANTDDPDTISVPIVSDADTAHAVAKRVVWEKIITAKPAEWATGPKYRYLLPTDVVTLTADDATYVHRIISAQRAQSGLVKFKSVPEKGALYSQVGAGIVGSGQEIPPVAFPPNSFLALGDWPPLRLEDDQLGYYAATCPYGTAGKWRGTILYKEELEDVYDRLTSFDRAAMIGFLRASMAPITNTLQMDRTTVVIIDFLYNDGTVASETEESILSRPLNQMVIETGFGAEVFRFANATPLTTAAGYAASYQFDTLLRGLNGTEYSAVLGHLAGATAVVLSDAVKFRREDPAELGRARNFAAVSVGQAQQDVIDNNLTSFTFQGFSKKPLSVTGIRAHRTTDGDIIIEWIRRVRVAGGIRSLIGVPLAEEKELYLFEVLDGVDVVYQAWIDKPSAVPVSWYDGRQGEFDEFNMRLRSELRLDPYNSFFEATLEIGSPSVGSISLWDTNYELARYLIGVLSAPAPDGFYIKEWNPLVGYEVKYQSPTFDGTFDGAFLGTIRPRFEIKNGELLVYETFLNDGTLPVYQATIPPPQIGPLALEAYCPLATPISVALAAAGASDRPRAVFPAGLQNDLFGGLVTEGDLSVRITQYSALVGPGLPASASV